MLRTRPAARFLAAAVALATAAPGPASAQAVRAVLPVEAKAPALTIQLQTAPSLAVPSYSLNPSLAPALIPSALTPALAAPAKAEKPAPKDQLAAAAKLALIKPDAPGGEAKTKAGAAFEGTAEKKGSSSEVAGAEGSGTAALAKPEAVSVKALPAIPVPARTVVSRLKAAWPQLLAAGAAAIVSFVLYKLGGAGAGLMPALGLMGTLAWNPTPGMKAAFLAAIRDTSAPGTVVPYEKIGRIGARLGLDAEKAGALFAGLVEDGHLAIRDNRDAVYHSFRSRADAGGPNEANDAALLGARLMNSGATIDHARAVAWADKAVTLYERAGPAEQLEEAKALRGNAMLEFFSSLLDAHVAALDAGAKTPALETRLADAREAREWLRTATWQTGAAPAMPRRIHAKLVALIGSINPSAEAGSPHAEEAADGYIAALDLLEKFDRRDFLFEKPSKGEAPAGGWEPSDALLLKFSAELRARGAAGETVTRETMMRAGKGLDLDAAQINAAVAALGARGELMILSNGAVVAFDFRDQAESDRDGLWDLHQEALDAVKLVNSADVRDQLRAVARLGAVHQKYFDARRDASREAGAYLQVGIALANAKLEAVSSVLAHEEKVLPADDAKLAAVRQARAWLAHAYYSAERRQRIDHASLSALNSAASLLAFRSVLDGKTEPLITQGVMQVRRFLSELKADAGDDDGPVPHPSGWRPLSKSEYPALVEFGIDLTGKAVEGKLPPMIGRKAEMRQVVKTLLRVEKNNPLVIGEKGVGKTAIANGLAQMIVAGEIPELAGKTIVKLDLTKIVAGTTLRGQFEERMVNILEEAKKSEGRILLFIDEIHMLVGAGDSEGSTDAANILKESLADGSISVIGATTMEEYRKIEKDGALARRFNPVKLNPPTKDEAVQIVEGVKSRYEEKHQVTVDMETVKAVVDMASRYVTDRHLPDSALDLLDDAGAEVQLKASEALAAGAPAESVRRAVLPEDVAHEIELRTGIPAGKIGKDEKEQLKALPAELGSKVVGQEEAVAKVSKGVQRGRMGLRNPKQPIGSFIFLGPTGVGKTEIARQTAKTVFGSEKNMVRLDMSEYMEKHSVSRMIGAPPGYVGFDQAGQLTEAVRRNPYTVVLLDEIEKAHPEVLDVLLQVIEDGRLTDGMGRTVDFSNTIIMMTSNIGGSLAGEDGTGSTLPNKRPRIGFIQDAPEKKPEAADVDARRAKYLAALKAKLRPEFINRVGEDGIVVFNELGAGEMKTILDLRVKDLQDQLAEKKVTVALTPAARAEILRRAEAQKAYGARPLKQVVERQVSDAIVEAELDGRIGEGDAVLVDWDAAKGSFTAAKAP